MIPPGWRPVYHYEAVEPGDCAVVPVPEGAAEARPQPIEPRFAKLDRIQGRQIVRRLGRIEIRTPRTALLKRSSRPWLRSPAHTGETW